MSQFITESIVAHGSPLAEWLTSSIDALKFIITNSFLVVGSAFSALFMIMVLRVFVKAMKGLNFSELFREDVTLNLSLTKFWTNIAYFTATVAFVGKVFISPNTSDSENMLWLIYLGVVGSNAIASRWLGLKYAGAIAGNTPQSTVTTQVTSVETTPQPK